MNGIHDLGGMHGFGGVEHDPREPLFHADWERTVLAVQLTALGQRLYNLDELRHSIERMPPDEYLNATYYERWLAAIDRLLIEKGVIDAAELERRAAAFQDDPQSIPHSSLRHPRRDGVCPPGAGPPPRPSLPP